MWTNAAAIVRYSLCTTPKLSFATANAVIFDIFKNRKYLDICINRSVLILILQQNINFRERIKEKRDRQADRQRDWQTDRRTDLHTFWQTKRHAAGGEKEKENETRRENQGEGEKRWERENSGIHNWYSIHQYIFESFVFKYELHSCV